MGLLFEKLKARQKPDGTFTPAPAEDTPMLSGSLLNVPRPEYSDKVEVELVSQTTIKPQTIYDIVKRSQKRNGRKNLGCYRIYWG